MLFYWWAPRSPSTVHKDAAWWWTGLAIKYAQQMGLHREPRNVHDVGGPKIQGLRRRIWWTLFSRERLTSICQGRPCTISPEDCNVREPSLEDFGPSPDLRARVFIQWVSLCGIIGRVGEHIRRDNDPASFPTELAKELIFWVTSLPAELVLPDLSARMWKFDRDVCKLHLPYLTTLSILHMNWTSQHPTQRLPEAYTTAILASSSVARIMRDLLIRGNIRFLGAIACWYVGVAIVALLHTQRIPKLASSGAEDIKTLRLALNELAILWPSTAIFVRGFERLRVFENLDKASNQNPIDQLQSGHTSEDADCSPALSDMNAMYGIDSKDYFPWLTGQSSGLAGIVLAEQQPEIWDLTWLGDATGQLQTLFGNADAFPDFAMTDWPAL
jgi:hypothetical protein